MNPAPDPSKHDDPSVNRIHGFGVTSLACASVDGPSSYGLSAVKSAKTWPRIDVLGLICLIGWSVTTTTGYAWKYHLNLLVACTSAKTSFSIELTALNASLVAQRVLKKGSDLSADLDKNLFKLANFSLRLCASFSFRGDCSFVTASAFSRHTLIPFMLTTCPRNTPSSSPNVHYLGLSHQRIPQACDQSDFQMLYPQDVGSKWIGSKTCKELVINGLYVCQEKGLEQGPWKTEAKEVRHTLPKVRCTLPSESKHNMDSGMGKMCLGEDVIEISSDQNEGSRDWDLPEYRDMAVSKGNKEPKTLVFHKMYTEEGSDRYIAQCFVNGLYASDGEINLAMDDNLISNDYAVKLCLEYEVSFGGTTSNSCNI
ncbi:hypothetical protein Tco_0435955 [Tanacetum coccineum]